MQQTGPPRFSANIRSSLSEVKGTFRRLNSIALANQKLLGIFCMIKLKLHTRSTLYGDDLNWLYFCGMHLANSRMDDVIMAYGKEVFFYILCNS